MKSGQAPLRRVFQSATAVPGKETVHLARRLERATASGWHSHRNLQWICAGDGVVTLETEEGQWVALPGQAIIVGSHVSHALSWDGAQFVESVYMEPGTVPFEPGEACFSTTVTPLLGAAVKSLIEEKHPYNTVFDSRSGLLIKLIIDEMPRNRRTLFGLPSPTSRSLRILCAHLREDPSNPWDIDEWADFSGISRRTLTRRLRDETGLSFVEWRQRARVIHALKLEVRGVASKQIAQASGYTSVQALRAELRKSVGGTIAALQKVRA